MIVIGKGTATRPDALTPHIIDDEMRVVGELKAGGYITSAYRRYICIPALRRARVLFARRGTQHRRRPRTNRHHPSPCRRETRDGRIRRELRNLNPHTAIDVFDIEPLPALHPLRSLPNTLLTGHIAYVTDDL
jgi:hypothetical protein